MAFLLLAPPDMNIRDVLFATDFSRASEAAGRVAREMALEMGACLCIALPGTDPGADAVALTEAAYNLGKGVSVETGSPRVARLARSSAMCVTNMWT